MVLNGLPFQSFEQKSGMPWFTMSSDHLEYCVENRMNMWDMVRKAAGETISQPQATTEGEIEHSLVIALRRPVGA